MTVTVYYRLVYNASLKPVPLFGLSKINMYRLYYCLP